MLNIIMAVYGGVMLFLGRSLSWLFSLGMGLLVGVKAAEFFVPPTSPAWINILVILGVGTLGVLPHLLYPEASFIVSGFLFGGYALAEYANLALSAFVTFRIGGPYWLVFFVGGVIGAVTQAFIKDWGVMFSTALIGAFLVAPNIGRPDALTQTLIAAGLFILGCIVQVVIRSFEEGSMV